MLGYRPAVEAGELAQRQSIGDPFAQLAIVPVLDAHENQRAQDLLRRQTAATTARLLQAADQVAPHPLNHRMLIVEEIGNGLQQRLQTDALSHQFPIGKTDLPCRCSRHRSALSASSSASRLSLALASTL